MKITVYTISTCPFSKQEKDYLTANKLSFEEKNVEEHREYLAEMLQAADKFAGVPVTVIEKDDGAKICLKGFTKEEFDKEFGFVQIKPEAPVTMANAGIKVPPPPPPPSPAPAQPQVAPSTPPPPSTPPAVSTTSDVVSPPVAPVASEATPPAATAATPSLDEELKSVLDNLEQKTEIPTVSQQETSQPVTSQPATSEPTKDQPSSPPVSPPDPNLPKIPDFPK